MAIENGGRGDEAGSPAGSGALGALALVFVEELFAQADGLGGDLDQFVVVDEFERLFQIEADRRGQENVLVGARGRIWSIASPSWG